VAGRTLAGEWPEIEVTGDAMDAEDFRVDVRDTVSQWVGYFNEQAAVSRQVTADRNLRRVLLHTPVMRTSSGRPPTAAGGHSGRMTRRKLDDHVL
jgi:hypothetical protein